jgi:hypothetical protein
VQAKQSTSVYLAGPSILHSFIYIFQDVLHEIINNASLDESME